MPAFYCQRVAERVLRLSQEFFMRGLLKLTNRLDYTRSSSSRRGTATMAAEAAFSLEDRLRTVSEDDEHAAPCLTYSHAAAAAPAAAASWLQGTRH